MALYAVTDRAWLGTRTLAEAAELALRGGVTCLQLREKTLDGAAFLQEAVELAALCRRYGVPLIINDNVDIALRSGADGVHIGQRDADAAATRRRIGPDKILGVSAHTVEQARRAVRDGADYLGAGAVFPTGTKPDAGAVTLETLRAIGDAVPVPVVAIGGVTLERIDSLAGVGISGVAVVSAVFAAPDIERAAAALRARVREVLGV